MKSLKVLMLLGAALTAVTGCSRFGTQVSVLDPVALDRAKGGPVSFNYPENWQVNATSLPGVPPGRKFDFTLSRQKNSVSKDAEQILPLTRCVLYVSPDNKAEHGTPPSIEAMKSMLQEPLKELPQKEEVTVTEIPAESRNLPPESHWVIAEFKTSHWQHVRWYEMRNPSSGTTYSSKITLDWQSQMLTLNSNNTPGLMHCFGNAHFANVTDALITEVAQTLKIERWD